MSNHTVSYEELVSYALGELSGDAERAVAGHVATCAECAASVSRFGIVQATLRLDAQAIPSPDALRRVQALITGRQPVKQNRVGVPESLRRVVAALTFDSRASYARAGLRGASDSYVLGYEAGETAVDVQIEHPAGVTSPECQVTGQIEGENAQVRILARTPDGSIAVESESDEHGVFLLNLATGQYDLELIRDEDVLVLAGLTIP